MRPQNLIGERFVECKPTQVRSANAEPPPELELIEDGPGEGQRLLPVENTTQSVDIDLIGNTMREPERERLSLILNELGTGLAGRGRDLNDVIRRANPALRETDEVLEILARQNTVLEQLAVNSDTILAPLARDRARVASAIRHSSSVAQATAERREALAADIQTLPRVPRRAGADDGGPRLARGRVDAGADRPRRARRRTSTTSCGASARSRRPRSRPSTRSARRPRPARPRSPTRGP